MKDGKTMENLAECEKTNYPVLTKQKMLSRSFGMVNSTQSMMSKTKRR